MKIEEGLKLDFDDVLIRPKRSEAPSRKDISLIRTLKCPRAQRGLRCVPIIAANMSTTGTFCMSNELAKEDMLTCLHKFYTLEDRLAYRKHCNGSATSFYTIGIKDADFEGLDTYCKKINNFPDKLCIDVANGYTKYFVNKVKILRERFPYTILMAGNVATAEMTQELLLAGADIVKVGIGPGSACTTRVKTGVGYPQLSAIIECADAAHGLQGLICADGGCRTPGDVAKAFGAGADLVMLGGMLAGVDECEGEWTEEGFEFFGMASKTAQDQFYDGVKDYTAAEGKTVVIPKKGPVRAVLKDLLGGLRSSCAYVGAASLKDFSKCCTFVRVSRTHNTIFGN